MNKTELVKQFLIDNFFEPHSTMWLESYANIMNKYNEINKLDTYEKEKNYFKSVTLKDNDYLNICSNDKKFMEDICLFYETN